MRNLRMWIRKYSKNHLKEVVFFVFALVSVFVAVNFLISKRSSFNSKAAISCSAIGSDRECRDTAGCRWESTSQTNQCSGNPGSSTCPSTCGTVPIYESCNRFTPPNCPSGCSIGEQTAQCPTTTDDKNCPVACRHYSSTICRLTDNNCSQSGCKKTLGGSAYCAGSNPDCNGLSQNSCTNVLGKAAGCTWKVATSDTCTGEYESFTGCSGTYVTGESCTGNYKTGDRCDTSKTYTSSTGYCTGNIYVQPTTSQTNPTPTPQCSLGEIKCESNNRRVICINGIFELAGECTTPVIPTSTLQNVPLLLAPTSTRMPTLSPLPTGFVAPTFSSYPSSTPIQRPVITLTPTPTQSISTTLLQTEIALDKPTPTLRKGQPAPTPRGITATQNSQAQAEIIKFCGNQPTGTETMADYLTRCNKIPDYQRPLVGALLMNDTEVKKACLDYVAKSTAPDDDYGAVVFTDSQACYSTKSARDVLLRALNNAATPNIKVLLAYSDQEALKYAAQVDNYIDKAAALVDINNKCRTQQGQKASCAEVALIQLELGKALSQVDPNYRNDAKVAAAVQLAADQIGEEGRVYSALLLTTNERVEAESKIKDYRLEKEARRIYQVGSDQDARYLCKDLVKLDPSLQKGMDSCNSGEESKDKILTWIGNRYDPAWDKFNLIENQTRSALELARNNYLEQQRLAALQSLLAIDQNQGAKDDYLNDSKKEAILNRISENDQKQKIVADFQIFNSAVGAYLNCFDSEAACQNVLKPAVAVFSKTEITPTLSEAKNGVQEIIAESKKDLGLMNPYFQGVQEMRQSLVYSKLFAAATNPAQFSRDLYATENWLKTNTGKVLTAADKAKLTQEARIYNLLVNPYRTREEVIAVCKNLIKENEACNQKSETILLELTQNHISTAFIKPNALALARQINEYAKRSTQTNILNQGEAQAGGSGNVQVFNQCRGDTLIETQKWTGRNGVTEIPTLTTCTFGCANGQCSMPSNNFNGWQQDALRYQKAVEAEMKVIGSSKLCGGCNEETIRVYAQYLLEHRGYQPMIFTDEGSLQNFNNEVGARVSVIRQTRGYITEKDAGDIYVQAQNEIRAEYSKDIAFAKQQCQTYSQQNIDDCVKNNSASDWRLFRQIAQPQDFVRLDDANTWFRRDDYNNLGLLNDDIRRQIVMGIRTPSSVVSYYNTVRQQDNNELLFTANALSMNNLNKGSATIVQGLDNINKGEGITGVRQVIGGAVTMGFIPAAAAVLVASLPVAGVVGLATGANLFSTYGIATVASQTITTAAAVHSLGHVAEVCPLDGSTDTLQCTLALGNSAFMWSSAGLNALSAEAGLLQTQAARAANAIASGAENAAVLEKIALENGVRALSKPWAGTFNYLNPANLVVQNAGAVVFTANAVDACFGEYFDILNCGSNVILAGLSAGRVTGLEQAIGQSFFGRIDAVTNVAMAGSACTAAAAGHGDWTACGQAIGFAGLSANHLRAHGINSSQTTESLGLKDLNTAREYLKANPHDVLAKNTYEAALRGVVYEQMELNRFANWRGERSLALDKAITDYKLYGDQQSRDLLLRLGRQHVYDQTLLRTSPFSFIQNLDSKYSTVRGEFKSAQEAFRRTRAESDRSNLETARLRAEIALGSKERALTIRNQIVDEMIEIELRRAELEAKLGTSSDGDIIIRIENLKKTYGALESRLELIDAVARYYHNLSIAKKPTIDVDVVQMTEMTQALSVAMKQRGGLGALQGENPLFEVNQRAGNTEFKLTNGGEAILGDKAETVRANLQKVVNALEVHLRDINNKPDLLLRRSGDAVSDQVSVIVAAVESDRGFSFDSKAGGGKTTTTIPGVALMRAILGEKQTIVLPNDSLLNTFLQRDNKTVAMFTDLLKGAGIKEGVLVIKPGDRYTAEQIKNARIIITTKEIAFDLNRDSSSKGIALREHLKAGALHVDEAQIVFDGTNYLSSQSVTYAQNHQFYETFLEVQTRLLENDAVKQAVEAVKLGQKSNDLITKDVRTWIWSDQALAKILRAELAKVQALPAELKGFSALNDRQLIDLVDAFAVKGRPSEAQALLRSITKFAEVLGKTPETDYLYVEKLKAIGPATNKASNGRQFSDLSELLAYQLIAEKTLGVKADLSQITIAGLGSETNYTRIAGLGAKAVFMYSGTPESVTLLGKMMGVETRNFEGISTFNAVKDRLVTWLTGNDVSYQQVTTLENLSLKTREKILSAVVVDSQTLTDTRVAELQKASGRNLIIIAHADGRFELRGDQFAYTGLDGKTIKSNVVIGENARDVVNKFIDNVTKTPGSPEMLVVYEFGAHTGTDITLSVRDTRGVIICNGCNRTDFAQGVSRFRSSKVTGEEGFYSKVDIIYVGKEAETWQKFFDADSGPLAKAQRNYEAQIAIDQGLEVMRNTVSEALRRVTESASGDVATINRLSQIEKAWRSSSEFVTSFKGDTLTAEGKLQYVLANEIRPVLQEIQKAVAGKAALKKVFDAYVGNPQTLEVKLDANRTVGILTADTTVSQTLDILGKHLAKYESSEVRFAEAEKAKQYIVQDQAQVAKAQAAGSRVEAVRQTIKATSNNLALTIARAFPVFSNTSTARLDLPQLQTLGIVGPSLNFVPTQWTQANILLTTGTTVALVPNQAILGFDASQIKSITFTHPTLKPITLNRTKTVAGVVMQPENVSGLQTLVTNVVSTIVNSVSDPIAQTITSIIPANWMTTSTANIATIRSLTSIIGPINAIQAPIAQVTYVAVRINGAVQTISLSSATNLKPDINSVVTLLDDKRVPIASYTVDTNGKTVLTDNSAWQQGVHKQARTPTSLATTFSSLAVALVPAQLINPIAPAIQTFMPLQQVASYDPMSLVLMSGAALLLSIVSMWGFIRSQFVINFKNIMLLGSILVSFVLAILGGMFGAASAGMYVSGSLLMALTALNTINTLSTIFLSIVSLTLWADKWASTIDFLAELLDKFKAPDILFKMEFGNRMLWLGLVFVIIMPIAFGVAMFVFSIPILVKGIILSGLLISLFSFFTYAFGGNWLRPFASIKNLIALGPTMANLFGKFTQRIKDFYYEQFREGVENWFYRETALKILATSAPLVIVFWGLILNYAMGGVESTYQIEVIIPAILLSLTLAGAMGVSIAALLFKDPDKIMDLLDWIVDKVSSIGKPVSLDSSQIPQTGIWTKIFSVLKYFIPAGLGILIAVLGQNFRIQILQITDSQLFLNAIRSYIPGVLIGYWLHKAVWDVLFKRFPKRWVAAFLTPIAVIAWFLFTRALPKTNETVVPSAVELPVSEPNVELPVSEPNVVGKKSEWKPSLTASEMALNLSLHEKVVLAYTNRDIKQPFFIGGTESNLSQRLSEAQDGLLIAVVGQGVYEKKGNELLLLPGQVGTYKLEELESIPELGTTINSRDSTKKLLVISKLQGINPAIRRNKQLYEKFVYVIDLGNITDNEMVDPVSLVPEVDNEEERLTLIGTRGLTGEVELQRSKFYRINPQIDALRTHVQSNMQNGKFTTDVLNIGPGRGEEMLTYIAASGPENISFDILDIQGPDDIKPQFILPRSITGALIDPPAEDIDGFVKNSTGDWEFNDGVKSEFTTGLTRRNANYYFTAVESFVKKFVDKFDIVTFNNVSQYLGRGFQKYANPLYGQTGDFTSFRAVLLSVAEHVREGGLLFIGIDDGNLARAKIIDFNLKQDSNFDQIFETVDLKNGIYRRKSADPLRMQKASSDQNLVAVKPAVAKQVVVQRNQLDIDLTKALEISIDQIPVGWTKLVITKKDGNIVEYTSTTTGLKRRIDLLQKPIRKHEFVKDDAPKPTAAVRPLIASEPSKFKNKYQISQDEINELMAEDYQISFNGIIYSFENDNFDNLADSLNTNTTNNFHLIYQNLNIVEYAWIDDDAKSQTPAVLAPVVPAVDESETPEEPEFVFQALQPESSPWGLMVIGLALTSFAMLGSRIVLSFIPQTNINEFFGSSSAYSIIATLLTILAIIPALITPLGFKNVRDFFGGLRSGFATTMAINRGPENASTYWESRVDQIKKILDGGEIVIGETTYDAPDQAIAVRDAIDRLPIGTQVFTVRFPGSAEILNYAVAHGKLFGNNFGKRVARVELINSGVVTRNKQFFPKNETILTPVENNLAPTANGIAITWEGDRQRLLMPEDEFSFVGGHEDYRHDSNRSVNVKFLGFDTDTGQVILDMTKIKPVNALRIRLARRLGTTSEEGISNAASRDNTWGIRSPLRKAFDRFWKVTKPFPTNIPASRSTGFYTAVSQGNLPVWMAPMTANGNQLAWRDFVLPVISLIGGITLIILAIFGISFFGLITPVIMIWLGIIMLIYASIANPFTAMFLANGDPEAAWVFLHKDASYLMPGISSRDDRSRFAINLMDQIHPDELTGKVWGRLPFLPRIPSILLDGMESSRIGIWFSHTWVGFIRNWLDSMQAIDYLDNFENVTMILDVVIDPSTGRARPANEQELIARLGSLQNQNGTVSYFTRLDQYAKLDAAINSRFNGTVFNPRVTQRQMPDAQGAVAGGDLTKALSNAAGANGQSMVVTNLEINNGKTYEFLPVLDATKEDITSRTAAGFGPGLIRDSQQLDFHPQHWVVVHLKDGFYKVKLMLLPTGSGEAEEVIIDARNIGQRLFHGIQMLGIYAAIIVGLGIILWWLFTTFFGPWAWMGIVIAVVLFNFAHLTAAAVARSLVLKPGGNLIRATTAGIARVASLGDDSIAKKLSMADFQDGGYIYFNHKGDPQENTDRKTQTYRYKVQANENNITRELVPERHLAELRLKRGVEYLWGGRNPLNIFKFLFPAFFGYPEYYPDGWKPISFDFFKNIPILNSIKGPVADWIAQFDILWIRKTGLLLNYKIAEWNITKKIGFINVSSLSVVPEQLEAYGLFWKDRVESAVWLIAGASMLGLVFSGAVLVNPLLLIAIPALAALTAPIFGIVTVYAWAPITPLAGFIGPIIIAVLMSVGLPGFGLPTIVVFGLYWLIAQFALWPTAVKLVPALTFFSDLPTPGSLLSRFGRIDNLNQYALYGLNNYAKSHELVKGILEIQGAGVLLDLKSILIMTVALLMVIPLIPFASSFLWGVSGPAASTSKLLFDDLYSKLINWINKMSGVPGSEASSNTESDYVAPLIQVDASPGRPIDETPAIPINRIDPSSGRPIDETPAIPGKQGDNLQEGITSGLQFLRGMILPFLSSMSITFGLLLFLWFWQSRTLTIKLIDIPTPSGTRIKAVRLTTPPGVPFPSWVTRLLDRPVKLTALHLASLTDKAKGIVIIPLDNWVSGTPYKGTSASWDGRTASILPGLTSRVTLGQYLSSFEQELIGITRIFKFLSDYSPFAWPFHISRPFLTWPLRVPPVIRAFADNVFEYVKIWNLVKGAERVSVRNYLSQTPKMYSSDYVITPTTNISSIVSLLATPEIGTQITIDNNSWVVLPGNLWVPTTVNDISYFRDLLGRNRGNVSIFTTNGNPVREERELGDLGKILSNPSNWSYGNNLVISGAGKIFYFDMSYLDRGLLYLGHVEAGKPGLGEEIMAQRSEVLVAKLVRQTMMENSFIAAFYHKDTSNLRTLDSRVSNIMARATIDPEALFQEILRLNPGSILSVSNSKDDLIGIRDIYYILKNNIIVPTNISYLDGTLSAWNLLYGADEVKIVGKVDGSDVSKSYKIDENSDPLDFVKFMSNLASGHFSPGTLLTAKVQNTLITWEFDGLEFKAQKEDIVNSNKP